MDNPTDADSKAFKFMPARVSEIPKQSDIETRLRNFYMKLTNTKFSKDVPITKSMKIGEIARRHHRAAAERNGLGHLEFSALQRIVGVPSNVPLSPPLSEARADEIGARLEEEMPWMNVANERVWKDMRLAAARGDAGFRTPNMIIAGPPGVGKSHWVRLFAELVQVPVCGFDATSSPSGQAIVGTQRGWGTSAPGRLVDTIFANEIANPIMLIDEIDKAGQSSSSAGTNHSMCDTLLPFLERMTAQSWTCPFFQVTMDMSWVSWVMTANDLSQLSGPLLNRVPPIEVTYPSPAHLRGFINRQAQLLGLPQEAVNAIHEAIEGAGPHSKTSLRTVKRMLDRADQILSAPMLH
ncbi:MAG: AAA family ATPase [Roseibium sp.]|uniref:AAA family ATPase n=1 Tax=Roseibium sp. TaxID=1936156 RepID=UPI00329A5156